MNKIDAKEISRKIRAFEHCEKVLRRVEKGGSAIVKLNNTGLTFVVNRGDALYLEFVAQHAALWRDIQAYEIVRNATAETKPSARTLPAPSGAADSKAEKHRAYQRAYMARKRAEAKQMKPLGNNV